MWEFWSLLLSVVIFVVMKIMGLWEKEVWSWFFSLFVVEEMEMCVVLMVFLCWKWEDLCCVGDWVVCCLVVISGENEM